MPLHRFVTPTYTGGLPGTHDLINVISGGTGAGGSSPADAAKIGGPNAGTYFVAFGEDATALNVNRISRALAENTDYLDDVVHRDLAVPSHQDFAGGGGPITDFQLAGTVFVGNVGAPNDSYTRNALIQITVPAVSGFPMFSLSGTVATPVLVTAIEASLGGGSVVGNGYQVNPVISVSPAIPSATPFTVHFLERTNVVAQDEEMFSLVHRGKGLFDAQLGAALINVVYHNTANTFLNGFTQTFAGDVTFDGGNTLTFGSGTFDVVSTVPQEDPIFNLPDAPHLTPNYLQLWEAQMRTAPAVDAHYYFGNDRNIVHTYNAEWDEGGAVWNRQQSSQTAMRLDLSFQTQELRMLVKRGPPATWADADWTTDPLTDSQLFFSMSAGIGRIAPDPADHDGVAVLVVSDPVDFATPEYEHVANLGGGVSGSLDHSGPSSLYVAYERVGLTRPGLSYVQNAFWNPDNTQWDSQIYYKEAWQHTLGQDGALAIRKKRQAQAPFNFDDDEWDWEGSLRDMQYSIWTESDSPIGSVVISSIAARPSSNGVGERWIASNSAGGAPDNTLYAAHPSGPWYSTSNVAAVPFTGGVFWDQLNGTFMGVHTATGQIEVSAIGIGWANSGSVGVPGIQQLIPGTTTGSGIIAKSPTAAVIYEAATVAGPFTVRTVSAAAGPVLDVTHCSESGLWVAVGEINASNTGIWTSPDRVTWTPRAIGGPALDTSGAGNFTAVAYNPVRNTVVAVGNIDAGDNQWIVAVSTDGGTTWTRVTVLEGPFPHVINTPMYLSPMKYMGGRFIAMGYIEVQATDHSLVVVGSADGLRWKHMRGASTGGAADTWGTADKYGDVTESVAAVISLVTNNVWHSATM